MTYTVTQSLPHSSYKIVCIMMSLTVVNMSSLVMVLLIVTLVKLIAFVKTLDEDCVYLLI